MDTIRATGGRICRICGRFRLLVEFGSDLHGWLRGRVCYRCQAKTRPKREADRTKSKVQARRRRAARETTWDGVTDSEIFARDDWTCQMPVCLNPNTRSITKAPWPDPWSRSVDHIVKLSEGGSDDVGNKRAAHLRCNISAGAKRRSRA